MCKHWGESIDHLLLHCEVANEVWNVFILESWRGQLGNRHALRMWRLVPLCVMWCLWRERKAHNFEDKESGMIELRKLLLNTLFSWSGTWLNSHESIFSYFLELCKSFSSQ
jgi:hypothetical protein